ncbi:DUF7344 domain-containing protein [Halospeciosus flavus]|uniref:DUF7344 domain-containing protein n=1 Tax=Halospeciosus flavus TaxID=3032283 RepID=A0ABD5Z333_9EURY|nr:hypothetical protein [Halospeciosus flavus]
MSNERRRRSLEYLVEREHATVREIADVVAAAEFGSSAPPDSVRTAVYVSLRQNHLPSLVDAGVIEFDTETNQVRVLDRARGVTMYLELVTRYGITWGEFYQYLGTVGFLVVLGSLLVFPIVSLISPLAWATIFLGVFAVMSAYQLWTDHWSLRRRLLP